VAALLLEKGADPNHLGAGYTALQAAVLKGDLPLVKALLSHGANPNIRMVKGTPVRRKSTDFFFSNTAEGTTAYMLAAKYLEPDIMRVLAAGGADIHQTMLNPPTQIAKPGDNKIVIPDGTTALMLAVGMGSSDRRSRRGVGVAEFGKVEPESRVLETVKVALSLGADVNAANENGDTAVHTATLFGYNTVVQVLADHGALLDVKNKRGLTPLAVAGGAGANRPDGPRGAAQPATAALLRQLGANQ
jgi:ankyrin repeat protein